MPRADLPKRFYQAVTVEAAPGGFVVLLDRKPARTPARAALVLPSRASAEAVAAEWTAQEGVVDPAYMPLTRIVNAALDGVASRMDMVSADIVRYAGSDLICYRSEEPEGLVARQEAEWDPLVRWAADTLGARLLLAAGIMPVEQSDKALEAVRAAVAPLDPLRLTSAHVMTTLTGSAVIALAVLRRRLELEDAWRAASVDEDWNISQWGEDAEAAARRAARFQEMAAAARLLDLLGD